jgi:cystathionine beta-lyase
MTITGLEEQEGAFEDLSIDELRRRGTAKWSFYGEDVLAAWVAEMDYPLAPALRAALHDAIERGATGYPPRADDTGLPAACSAWLTQRFGAAVEPHQIRILPDVLHGIVVAIELFSPPASAVVVPTPSYPPFFETVRVAGRAIVEVPMAVEDGGRPVLDLDAIDNALRAGARTVILCHPHNPLGRVFTHMELAALAETVGRHGARVVIDALHAPLVYPGVTYVPYAAVSEAAAYHSVTLISASKGWNLPGLKCAQAVLSNPADLALWDRASFLRTGGASILGILANRVAYEQGEAWRAQTVAYLAGNRDLLGDLLADLLPQVRYTPPQATYLAWLDCAALALDDPARFFLKQASVALSGGADFGAPGRGHVRLNFATSRAILTRIVQRMAAAVEEHHRP